jgi:uncharacterized membrane protein
MVAYDILYLCFHTGSTQIEGLYIGILVIINLIAFLLKVIYIICAIVLKVKVQRSQEEKEEASLNK